VTSLSPGIRNSGSRNFERCAYFVILGFRISRLWDSCVGESRLLTSPSPGNRNSEMESLLGCLFWDFGVSHFATSRVERLEHFIPLTFQSAKA
jgi:hypothetical protein